MALLVGGGVLSLFAVGFTAGCGVDHAFPFRPIPYDAAVDRDTGGSGGADGGADADAGTDTGPILCSATQVGYSTVGTGTTGGGNGTPVVVSTLAQLQTQAAVVGPLVIAIHGVIDFGTVMPNQVEVTSDKTITAAEPGAGLVNGGLIIKMQHNVIVRNLTIAKPRAPADAVGIQMSDHVWIDHCDFSSDPSMPKDTYDGMVDITHASDAVTISWTRFHDHINNTSLVGHSDTNAAEDTGHLTVTYHHNLFRNTPVGSPRTRFGHIHVFDNYYDTIDSYAVASAMSATVLVEANVFDRAAIPITTHWEDPEDGSVWDLNNLYNPTSSAGNNMITTPMNNWKPPYVYMPDSKDSVRALVQACAGPGKVP